MIRSLFAFVLVLATGCVGPPPVSAQTSFVLVRRGDDGLTIKIIDAVQAALLSSGRFVRGNDADQADVRIEFGGHAVWRRVGDRTDASIGLTLYRRDAFAAGTTIRCYEDELEVCGRAVLAFAEQHAG